MFSPGHSDLTRTSRKPRKKPVQRPTLALLQDAALRYLERQAASTGMLRQVLRRRVRKAMLQHTDIDIEQTEAWIAAIIDKLVSRKLLNDAEFAALRTDSLRRQGRSARIIRQKLARQGVATPALGGKDEDLAAARLFARKKRLGPWRTATTPDTESRRRKDFAAMARAGFSYDIAAHILKFRPEEDDTGSRDLG